jgi:hypothetical protein
MWIGVTERAPDSSLTNIKICLGGLSVDSDIFKLHLTYLIPEGQRLQGFVISTGKLTSGETAHMEKHATVSDSPSDF